VTAPAEADGSQDIRNDADFVRSLQLADGAIVSDVTRRQVEPYVANYAAWGLARAARETGSKTYVNAGVRWLRWYQDHMDADGVVHDYVVVRKRPEVTDDEDSVDATSGLFLLALREASLAVPLGSQRDLLEQFRPGIGRAVHAIESLRDGDGLTWAKPSWRVKYLMDNAEAYGGLLAAGDVATTLGDSGLAASALAGAARAKEGAQTLWDPERQAYDWAKHANGYRADRLRHAVSRRGGAGMGGGVRHRRCVSVAGSHGAVQPVAAELGPANRRRDVLERHSLSPRRRLLARRRLGLPPGGRLVTG
jgi:hypothetical protein